MTVLTHTYYMAARHLRALMRQPMYVALTLAQPILYLLLFGALFQKIVELPGFGATSYITFLTPGIVVMSALFGAAWTGMGVLEDIDRGVLDRFLVTPASRVSLILGILVKQAVVAVIQSAIIVVLGVLVGARFAGGMPGVVALLVCAVLLTAPFAALMTAMALAVRKQESVIGASNFILMPLLFLSSVFIASSLMPPWMRTVARLNPVDWAAEASRAALGAGADWGMVASRAGLLVALAIVGLALAMRAFRGYQRSV
ncbi:MAG: ABC transporter permease [Chloroflexota bacterium]